MGSIYKITITCEIILQNTMKRQNSCQWLNGAYTSTLKRLLDSFMKLTENVCVEVFSSTSLPYLIKDLWESNNLNSFVRMWTQKLAYEVEMQLFVLTLRRSWSDQIIAVDFTRIAKKTFNEKNNIQIIGFASLYDSWLSNFYCALI
ncbi:CLUMA_CG007635, isoform A [Clunio marinus]|uniref:CLUMA_CG007635, isoform A n=1 Tax=Clunio marinus TaxID=568069 RepID=A0A1J1I1A6_9DIPT|nr:CLUMA_CG007635, isoform A [Clunio marinus]